MLEQENCALIIVDVQGKLAEIVQNSKELHKKIVQLINGSQILNIPIILVEQNPEKLGPTSANIASLLNNQEAIPKMTFSAFQTKEVRSAIRTSGKNQFLIAGIESHICVYQTAKDLSKENYHVEVVADAVSSRGSQQHQIALNRMTAENISLTTVEMALYELLKSAEHPKFKDILKIIK